jgi:Immunoglobulin-like domain of bacterial spore germination/Sporulation and spore germination
MSEPDEPEDRLSALLADEARTVEPSDGSLGLILERAHARRPNRPWIAPVLAAAAAVTAVSVVGVALAGRDHRTPAASGTHSGRAVTPSTTAPTVSQTSRKPSIAPATGAVVAVYFAGTFGGNTLLYREYHPAAGWTGSKAVGEITDALDSMLAGPTDPDYRSLWASNGEPGPRVTVSGTTATVAMPAQPAAPRGIAVQEIVYTVTATDPAVRNVVVTFPGGGAGPVGREPAWMTLAPVWVTSPTEGAMVHSPVTFSGAAIVFEATVTWQITRADGAVVAHGSTMATIAAPDKGTWSFRQALPAGHYVIRAFEVSAEDGSIRWTDTKDFSVG